MCFFNHLPDFHTSLCTQIYPLFLSLSLSQITGSFMAFNNNFDTDVLHF